MYFIIFIKLLKRKEQTMILHLVNMVKSMIGSMQCHLIKIFFQGKTIVMLKK